MTDHAAGSLRLRLVSMFTIFALAASAGAVLASASAPARSVEGLLAASHVAVIGA